MADTPESSTPSVPDIQSRLRTVARTLRQSRSVDAESQRVLAELVDELSAALQTASVPPAEVARLADSTAHLAESLHHHHDTGMLGRARERLLGGPSAGIWKRRPTRLAASWRDSRCLPPRWPSRCLWH